MRAIACPVEGNPLCVALCAGLGVKDPVQRENRMSTWAAMQDLYDGGLARAIGVSNYTTVHVEQLLSSPECRVKPAVNQVELHPLYQQRALRAFCSSHSIAVVPYSSLGEGSSELLGNEVVVRIASELTHADDGAVVTAAQVGSSMLERSLSFWCLYLSICLCCVPPLMSGAVKVVITVRVMCCNPKVRE